MGGMEMLAQLLLTQSREDAEAQRIRRGTKCSFWPDYFFFSFASSRLCAFALITIWVNARVVAIFKSA
jgi:hypothetical protein